ncbi:capsule biosynthesis protein [Enterobacter ludwigii]
MKNAAFTKLLDGKKYLLLQGPMGPFFSDLASWLNSIERETINVVFNGGDRFYCRQRHVLTYLKPLSAFPDWLSEIYQQSGFDSILCFGDCRPLHQAAKCWAQDKHVRFLVFEEGYFRPNFITLEEGGVNAYSLLPRDTEFYHALTASSPLVYNKNAASSVKRIAHAVWYCLMCGYHQHDFVNYQHHKSISIWYETKCWIRSCWRKVAYRLKQQSALNKIKKEMSGRYYLAILQVYNDSQIFHHSPYADIEDYIRSVILSFCQSAPQDSYLLFKHHPMDRGHRNYAQLIKSVSLKSGVSTKVIYVHDLPLDDLLSHARAVVTINSTVGLKALAKIKPLKVLGRAMYDIRGMTYQGCLDDFWLAEFQPDAILICKFEKYLRENTQLNMEFYARGKNRMINK